MDIQKFINSGIIHEVLKCQNEEILKEIAVWKGMNEKEEGEFLKKYHLPIYYMPEMTKNMSVEKGQKIKEGISIYAFKG